MTKLQYRFIPPWKLPNFREHTQQFILLQFRGRGSFNDVSLAFMKWDGLCPHMTVVYTFRKILRRLKPTPFLICHSQHEFLCPINKRTCLFCVEFSMELNDQAWLSSNTVVLFIHHPKSTKILLKAIFVLISFNFRR